ncbi:MAG: RING finger domain-containing protein [Sulfobacillus sp.]
MPDGTFYVGQWQNGLRHGPGTLRLPDGTCHVTHWQNDNMTGKGTTYRPDGTKLYEGDYFDGMAHGEGTSFYGDGAKYYEGEFRHGEPHGKGTGYLKDGIRYYVGEWRRCSFVGTVYVYELVLRHKELSNEICVICLEDLAKNCEVSSREDFGTFPFSRGKNRPIEISVCRHRFHSDCLGDWFARGQHTCPVCRRPALAGARARG